MRHPGQECKDKIRNNYLTHLKMDLESLLAGGMGGMMPQSGTPGKDTPMADTSETIQVSSVALLKMLKHGRAGVPMEVMGLMLGEFVDDYTVKVVDVFAMPQSGTGVSVEAVDPVFQTKMLDMLKQTGRPETVVGWYHSHPGFGPWLSSVDVNTQMSFEALNKRAVALVIDPIQSVRGKVVIDAFRLIPSHAMISQSEPRQTTSNIGHLHKPSIVALIHGLNRHYYSMPIDCRRGAEGERNLLIASGATLTLGGHTNSQHDSSNIFSQSSSAPESTASMATLASNYAKHIDEELSLNAEALQTRHVGRQDPKRHLLQCAENIVSAHADHLVSTMVKQEIF